MLPVIIAIAVFLLCAFLCYAVIVAGNNDRDKEDEEQMDYLRQWREKHHK